MIAILVYIVFFSLIAFLAFNGISGILNTALRIKRYVVSHKIFIGAVGFTGEAFLSIGFNTMSITVAAKLVEAAIGSYTTVDLNVFLAAGFLIALVGWFMKLWYNKNI